MVSSTSLSGFMDLLTFQYITSNYDTIMRARTYCCALGQLSLNDSTNIESIKEMLDCIKKESEKIEPLHRDGAERAIFVITLPKETNLVKNLEILGFQMIYEFHRRACYPEDSMLKLCIISW